jgi:hypothetical protein
VPGTKISLQGADIRIVYNPLDAVALARANSGKKIIFLAVGFETTAPLVAACALEAARLKIKNFYIYCCLKTIPPALQLPLYKYIFENDENNKNAEAVECALYGVKECRWEGFPRDEAIYSAHIRIIKTILDEINGGFPFEYDENDECDCANCKFFYICR